MTKVLLDTNILIYAIDEDSKYFHRAHDLLYNNDIDLFTTTKNISEFLAVTTRFPNNPLSLKDALMVVEDFQMICTVLFTTNKSFQLFIDLIRNYEPQGLLIHDFEIISIALAHQIDTIATFNRKDFEKAAEVKLFPL